MKTYDVTTTSLLRLEERLRQERETFNQRKDQEARWFTLRLSIGYISAILLPAVAIVCIVIIFFHQEFDSFVVKSASATLFVDVIGLMGAVWKVVLSPRSNTKLQPITSSDVPN